MSDEKEERFEVGDVVRWRREYYRVTCRRPCDRPGMPAFVYDLDYLCNLDGVTLQGSLNRIGTWAIDLVRPDAMMLIALEVR